MVVEISLLETMSSTLAAPWKGWRGSGEWGMGPTHQRMYSARTQKDHTTAEKVVD
jgi:hypothetical protein